VLLTSIAVLILLSVLTMRTLASGSPKPGSAALPPGPSGSSGPTSHTSTAASTPTQTPTPAPTAAGTASSASPASGAQSAVSAPCKPAQLKVEALVGKPTYAVGDQPELVLQVTNAGPAACVQDVADSQIELRVYNGTSRVWGSHDCQIQPGVDLRTFDVGKPAGFSVVWSGLSSQPSCAGTRQRVGAGTYTLYASLAGQDGTIAQFSIT
jgi:hypothetical protein